MSAHDPLGEKWIMVNNEKDISENPIPNPSILQWGEHVSNKTFNAGEEINFAVDTNIISTTLEIETDDLFIQWEFLNDQGETMRKDFGANISHTFQSTSNYFLKIEVYNSGKLILHDSLMIVVGEMPKADKIQVSNANSVKDAIIYNISRNKEITFEVVNPDTANYSYTWDLGDGHKIEGVSASKVFRITKMPAYIILRKTDIKTNIFSDSYIRLESDDPQEFEVVMPPVKMDSESQSNIDPTINIPTALILLSVLVVSVIAFFVFKKFKKPERI